MPVHRVLVDGELERAIEDIERVERVVSTQLVGDGCVLVFTEKRGKQHRLSPGERETRS